MISFEVGLLTSLAAVAHAGGVLWYAKRIGYKVLPSDVDGLKFSTLLWIYSGLIIKIVVPLLLLIVYALVAPIVLFSLGLVLAIRDEMKGSAGDTLGVIYLNLWPYYVILFVVAGGFEYILRPATGLFV